MTDLLRIAKDIVGPPYFRLKSTFTFDVGGDWRDTVLLSSGARMGSTWVSGLINYKNDYRYLFEPSLARPLVPPNDWETAGDRRIMYIRPDNDDIGLREQAQQVLEGRFYHPRTDQYNRRLISSKRLVKEVTANLFIKWLHVQFSGMPIVLLLRHPLPTVRSRAYEYFQAAPADRARFDPNPEQRTRDYLHLVFGQRELVADHLEPMRAVLESAHTMLEQRVAIWCIQHYVPLRQFRSGEIHLAFYENFCVDPRNELRALFEYLNKPLQDAPTSRLRKPSQTMQLSGIKEMPDGWEVVSRWRRKVDAEEMASALRILKAFGLDAIYGADPMPNSAAAWAMLAR